MPKNVVVCCDGTANEFAANRTNVIKLYSTLVQDSAVQVTFYHPGIGTMEPSGALTPIARKVTRLLGMAVGYGLENDIRDAYEFLLNTYESGDRIFLFGFSRGAYTVRAVASLISMYGIIRKGNASLIPYAIRMMMGIQRAEGDKKAVSRYFSLAGEFKETMGCASPEIHFVGVWDTVSSVGWIENPLHLPYAANNPAIHFGRHAISIDERRAFFRSNLWRRPQDSQKPFGPRDQKQVWFAGVHCDVGGGYCEQNSDLSKFPLKWMLEEAKVAGLKVNAEVADRVLGPFQDPGYIPANPPGPIHKSLTKCWHIAEFIPKKAWNEDTKRTSYRMNFYRRRKIPAGSLVHESVYHQGSEYLKRIPAGAVPVSTLRVVAPGPPESLQQPASV